MKRLTLILLLIISVYLFADWNEIDKILSSDGAAGDYFGLSVSIFGDYAIIGAWYDDDDGLNSGSAYIFQRNGSNWSEQAKLTASDGAAQDYFGYSVSISGDYALIGAHADDDNGNSSGSAYIFHRNGSNWTEQAKLAASDGAVEDFFGISVSIFGDQALIGAQGDDDNGSFSGSAYIFSRNGNNWTEQAKLTASDGAEDDRFGESVSINGDYALIGAHADDDNGNTSGSAYIFNRNGNNWIEQAKLIASDGDIGDGFGNSVSLSGDYAVIGAASDDNNNGYASGSAYIFHKNGNNWIEQAKLITSDGAVEDFFGYSVSFSGDQALIGAQGDDDNGSFSGSAYIFTRNGSNWTEQTKLTSSDGDEEDRFGYSVSICGDYLVIGAYGDDDNGNASGSAYIFHNDVLAIEDEVISSNTIVVGNYPNPFNPTTTISFSIPIESEIELSIYNIQGQKIKQLISDQISAGQHSIIWNGKDDLGKSVSSGIYYYKLTLNDKTEAVKKCLLLK